ncbi:MAG: hypothetical protein J5858_07980 [Lentisphaeria bacterium]|nr:hypothetical protein [Lentisphaeria bacterium]
MMNSFRHDRYFESGRKFFCGGLPVVELRGSWFQMGRQYGALLREELRKVLGFAEKNPAGISRIGRPGHRGISGLKRYDELYRGMAETSGLTLDQLRTVCSVELICRNRMSDPHREAFNGGRRTSLAVAVWDSHTPDGKVLFGRNYDRQPDFEEILDTLVLAVFHPGDGANAVAMLNWTGCLYLTTGMNENGLFLELNGTPSADGGAEPGRIQNMWLLWEFLLDCSDFDSLRASLLSCRSSAVYRICAADPVQAELFDWRPDTPCKPEPHDRGLLAAASHLNCMQEYLDGDRRIGISELTEILDKNAAEGGADVSGTLFQIIAEPAEQNWYVKLKTQTVWTEIPLMNLLKGNGELA